MKVGIEKGVGCNFCNMGKLTASGNDLIYPYEVVYTIENTKSGIKANICEDCIKDLTSKTFMTPLNIGDK